MNRTRNALLIVAGLGVLPATPLLAGTQDNAKLALHGQAALPDCTPPGIACSGFSTQRPLGASYVILSVGQADPVAGVSGLSYGVDYQGSAGVGIDPAWVTWTGCTDGLEFPNSGPNGVYPAPGGGIRITWSTCQSTVVGSDGAHAYAGFFYVYAYSSDLLEITPNNNVGGGPELIVGDCAFTDSDIPVGQVGSVGFGTSLGSNPCGSADATPPTVTSVEATGFAVDGSGQIATSTTQVSVQFSEALGTGAIVAGNYSVSNTPASVLSAALDGLDRVTLTLSDPVGPSAAFYEVTVTGVEDVAGNPIVEDGVGNLKAFFLKRLDFQVDLSIFLPTYSSPPDVFAIEGDLSPLTFTLLDNALLLDPDLDDVYETSVPISVPRNEGTGVAETTLEWRASHNTEGLEPRANRQHPISSDDGPIDVLNIYWNDETTPSVTWTDLGAPVLTGQTNGAAWGDFNDDGYEDLYIVSFDQANVLLINDGLGGFTADSSGDLGDTSEGYGTSWADYDNDGDLDLSFVNTNAPMKLLRNDGGVFVDATSGPLLIDQGRLSAAWGDYDNDGDLDLFCAGYPSVLFENLGSGNFIDVTPPELSVHGGNGGWGDYDNDGDLDLFMIGNGYANKLMRNDEGVFTEDATSPATQDAGGAVGMAWGDYDNDGDLDLFVGNFGGGSHLLRNDSGVLVEDTTSEALWDPLDGGYCLWFDYDNDGDLDLYMDTYFNNTRLYRNDGGGVFTEVSAPPINYEGAGMEYADYDNDGDLDVFIPGSPNKLIRNDLPPGINNWLQVRLRGTVADASGIGARLRVVTGSISMIREIVSGKQIGGHSSLIAAFGLGPGGNPDTVEVRWPSGITQRFTGIAPDQRIDLVEPVSLRLSHVTPDLLRAEDPVTLTIVGTGLDPSGATITLDGPGGLFVASGATLIDPEHVEATFNLAAAAPGTYKLRFDTPGLGKRYLRQAVLVYDEVVDLFRSTNAPSDDEFPVFPRSGAGSTTLAFISGPFGGADLVVKEPFAPDATRISLTSTDPPYVSSRPAWSPDGSEILYVGEDYRFRLVDSALGDAAGVQIIEPGGTFTRLPSWSPSGLSVVYGQYDAGFNSYIYTLDFATETPVQVTDHSGTGGDNAIDFSPDWSSDESHIAFTRYAFGLASSSILRIPNPGGEAAGLDTLSLGGAYSNIEPVYSPDGRWIAFASNRLGNYDIWVMDSRGESFGLYQITTSLAADGEPSWSPDGTQIAFGSTRTGNTDIFIASNLGLPDDRDGDGLADVLDACPFLAPGPGEIDRDYDGCPDETSSFRMIRFWDDANLPFQYETDALGHPDIGGSEFTELQAAFDAWTSIPGLAISGAGGDDGTRAGPSNPVSGDGRNSISFMDEDGFLFGTIAITPTSVATGDTTIGARTYRAGETIDADILFNTRDFGFSTPTHDAGPSAFDLRSVAAHEFGHALGFAHTPIERSTMFYVVTRGSSVASLEADDIVLARRGYGSPQLTIEGRVLFPDEATPVVGAAVYAITVSGDTTQMTFSGIDGTYRLYDLGEDFRIHVTPLDGSVNVNGLSPGAVNSVLAEYVDVGFLPEFLDAVETNDDFGSPGSVFSPMPSPITGADIVLNRDQTAPQVLSTHPADGEPAAEAVGALLVEFDEKLSEALFALNPDISLRNVDQGTGVGGVASLLHYGDRLAFTPSAPLSYDTNYEFTIGPDLVDLSGNAMAAPVVVGFRTRSQPSTVLQSATPAEVPLGGVLVLRGSGFDPDPAGNLVSFAGAAPVNPAQATLDRLTVVVPADAASGNVTVTVGPETSNPLFIQVVPPRALPVGNEIASTSLAAVVRKLAIVPGGLEAFVATSDGLVVVDADPSSPTFLQKTTIPIGGGATDVTVLPTGDIALAVGSTPNTLYAIDATSSALIQQVPLAGEPLGMSVVPGGTEVIITYADRVVLHSAVPGPTFGAELKQWSSEEFGFLGDVTVSPDGTQVYATTTDGKVAILGTASGEDILAVVDGGTNPQEIVALPDGSGFVVGDSEGTVRLYDAQGNLLDTETVEGGFSGLSVSPEGNYIFGANLIINGGEILKVGESSLVSENRFATGIDPRDCVVGPGGRYYYTVTGAGNLFEVYDTQAGPRVESVHPRSGGAGTVVTIAGSGFDPVPQNNLVRIGSTAHTPVSGDPSTLVIVQDAAASGRALRVEVAGQASNSARYRVVNRPGPGNFLDAGTLSTGTGVQLSRLAESPDGTLLIGLYADGGMQVMQADPRDPHLLRPLQDLTPAETGLSAAAPMLFSNHGRKLYVIEGGAVAVFDVVPGAAAPLARAGSVEDGGATAALAADELAPTPDGRRLLVRSEAGGVVHEVDAAADTVLGPVTGFAGAPLSFAVDPRGGRIFVGSTGGSGPLVEVVDIDPASAGYRSVTGSVPLGAATGPARLACSPDGTRLYAVGGSAGGEAQIEVVDVSVLAGTVVQTVPFVGQTSPPVVLPGRSGTVLYTLTTGAPFEIAALDAATFTRIPGPGADPGLAQAGNLSLSLDDARLYAAVAGDALKVVDLTPVTGLKVVSGFDQIGVAGETLPAPLVARVTGPDPALVSGGVVRYEAAPPGGSFGYADRLAVAAADAGGFVSAGYIAGPDPGQDEVQVRAAGLLVTRFLTVVSDTAGAPPQIISVRPTLGGEEPGVNTRIAVDFSKAVDPATVDVSSFQVREPAAPPLSGFFTYANDGRRAVFTPASPLATSTAYEIELTAAVADADALALANPGVFPFATAPAPPLELTSVFAASGKIGIPVVLSGTGFNPDPALNKALFDEIEAEITGSDPGALFATVPFGLLEGPVSVRVVAALDTSNALPFVVLNPLPLPINQVTGILDVPASGQRIAITPDGTRAYMTSREAGAIVPIVIEDVTTEQPIPTGVEPFGIAMAPDGARAYVTNFGSNTVSVIGTDPGEPATFHQVIATIPTYANPTAIAVHPDGRTLYVVHYGEPVLNIIDVDPTNANEFRARSKVDTGSTSKTVKVTPDGGILVVGTSTGILILNSSDGSARKNVDTASSAKTVEVTPDGAFALVLTDDERILLIDIKPGSPTEGQARSSTKTASNPKEIKVSPDGGFSYVTHEDGFVAVYSIDILSGEAAVENEAFTSPFRLVAVDTVEVGENPIGIDTDPSGSGLILVVNSGDNTVTFINGSEEIVYHPALVDINPNILNLNSNGQFVFANLQFVDFIDPAKLDLSSVLLEDTVPADPSYSELGDYNLDGVLEQRVRFPRLEAFEVIPEGELVPLRVSGMADDNFFAGEDSLEILRPRRTSPRPHDALASGVETEITWEPIENDKVNRVEIFFSGNGGNSWQALGGAAGQDSTYLWEPPDTTSESCFLLLVARDSTVTDTAGSGAPSLALSSGAPATPPPPVPGVVGYGGLDAPFTVSSTTDIGPEVLPLRFALMPPTPNPSHSITGIRFELPAPRKVTVRIFGIDGSLVREVLNDAPYPAGRHHVVWDGTNRRGQQVAGGVYFVRVAAGVDRAVRKIIRIR